ncbi:hypothetical protein JKY72_04820 [Candidatus Gracilibacteria bacterium]|nr:hypothetical protein [Candidatus Gracilibacteria bacterium]
MCDNFSTSVFINCPYDPEYLPLMRALIFVIVYCGFTPRLAAERTDSGETRFDKIMELIEACQYSIHDLSRVKAKKIGELYRLNIPFEIGLDLGCRKYKLPNKKCLVLEASRHECQKALSDLAHVDLKHHDEDSESLIIAIRNWFSELGVDDLDGGAKIWNMYNYFWADFYSEREKAGFSHKEINNTTIPEFLKKIKPWIEKNS